MTTPGGNDYNLRIVALPLTVLGAVVLLDDGTYDIFLNAQIGEDMQKKALEHEIRHIDGGHLYNDILTADQMELEADGKLQPPVEEPQRVPDVFGADKREGYIPLFHSLDAMTAYLRALAAQKREDKV